MKSKYAIFLLFCILLSSMVFSDSAVLQTSGNSSLPYVQMGYAKICSLDGDNIFTGENIFTGNVTFTNPPTGINNVNNSQYLNGHPDTYFLPIADVCTESTSCDFVTYTALQNSTIVRMGTANQTKSYCGNITGSNVDLCNVPSTDISGLVPYSGAVGDVNLNNKSIINIYYIQVSELNVSNNSIYIGGVKISSTGEELIIAGNTTSDFYKGSGKYLTDVNSSNISIYSINATYANYSNISGSTICNGTNVLLGNGSCVPLAVQTNISSYYGSQLSSIDADLNRTLGFTAIPRQIIIDGSTWYNVTDYSYNISHIIFLNRVFNSQLIVVTS